MFIVTWYMVLMKKKNDIIIKNKINEDLFLHFCDFCSLK